MEQEELRSGEAGGANEGGSKGWTREQRIEAGRERGGEKRGRAERAERRRGVRKQGALELKIGWAGARWVSL